MPLTADRVETVNGLQVHDYNLLVHNPNKIDLPSRARSKTVAITIHNTENIIVASNTTPAEQYVRATLNGNMRDCRVNYYVDETCAWRCLPDDWVNWSCADGCSNPKSGNNTSVAIEVIGSSKKVEENCIKLVAYLMHKYGLEMEGLRTHSYWMNVRDGKTGSIEELNVMKRSDKNCPAYILPHWNDFKNSVRQALAIYTAKQSNVQKKEECYRVRKTWEDESSQLGAFVSLDLAKEACIAGYCVFDNDGNWVYGTQETKKEVDKNNPNVYYKSYCYGKWLNEIINCHDNDSMGYSGIVGKPLNGLCARSDIGELFYRVHVKNGGWLSWIHKYEPDNWYNGCAGLKTQVIDGIQCELHGAPEYEVQYRVSVGGAYLPWVLGLRDFAGIFGKNVDRIQMKIVKK